MPDSASENNAPSSRVELPPVREFNDRATLWLLEDAHNLRDLLKIHSPPLVEHLDFDRAERLNRSFIPPGLQKLVELLQAQSRQSKFSEREEWQTMETSYADFLKEQGRNEALRTALETVLKARFGKLPKKIHQAILTAETDKINVWIQAGATANTLEEVGILSPQ